MTVSGASGCGTSAAGACCGRSHRASPVRRLVEPGRHARRHRRLRDALRGLGGAGLGRRDRPARLCEQAPDGAIQTIAYSPNGKYLGAPNRLGYAQILDIAGGRAVTTFEDHAGEVLSLAFSPDGTRAVTGSTDGTARIWDVLTGRQLLRPSRPSRGGLLRRLRRRRDPGGDRGPEQDQSQSPGTSRPGGVATGCRSTPTRAAWRASSTRRTASSCSPPASSTDGRSCGTPHWEAPALVQPLDRPRTCRSSAAAACRRRSEGRSPNGKLGAELQRSGQHAAPRSGHRPGHRHDRQTCPRARRSNPTEHAGSAVGNADGDPSGLGRHSAADQLRSHLRRSARRTSTVSLPATTACSSRPPARTPLDRPHSSGPARSCSTLTPARRAS